jgi:hypothetical protein
MLHSRGFQTQAAVFRLTSPGTINTPSLANMPAA